MTIAAILRHKGHTIATATPSATVGDVCHILAEHRIGALPVVDEQGHIVGMLSERDVVRALAAHGPLALEMSAARLMTRAIRTAVPSTTIGEAMAIMTEGRFRHLPVLEAGRLVGIVSIGDVVKARIDEADQVVDSLRAYVAGAA
jgi:CBS domain-containing protein